MQDVGLVAGAPSLGATSTVGGGARDILPLVPLLHFATFVPFSFAYSALSIIPSLSRALASTLCRSLARSLLHPTMFSTKLFTFFFFPFNTRRTLYFERFKSENSSGVIHARFLPQSNCADQIVFYKNPIG